MDLTYIDNLSLEDLMCNILPPGSIIKKEKGKTYWQWSSEIIGNEGWVIAQQEEESFKGFIIRVIKELIESHHRYHQHGSTSIHTGEGDRDQIEEVSDQDDSTGS